MGVAYIDSILTSTFDTSLITASHAPSSERNLVSRVMFSRSISPIDGASMPSTFFSLLRRISPCVCCLRELKPSRIVNISLCAFQSFGFCSTQ